MIYIPEIYEDDYESKQSNLFSLLNTQEKAEQICNPQHKSCGNKYLPKKTSDYGNGRAIHPISI